jgi:hypothetical protein
MPAFIYNDLPHGDIHLDYAAAWSLLTSGRLILPFISHHPYPNPYPGFGYPLDQHAPLWPLLGALGGYIYGDIYTVFKFITMFFGILIVPLSYFSFNRAFGSEPALVASPSIMISYLLIDYSGNGSLYIFHAFLLLCFPLLIDSSRRGNNLLLGLLAGLAYLLNYQAAIIPLAVAAVYILGFRTSQGFRAKIPGLLGFLGAFFLTISPWLIRNWLVFGSPLFSVNPYFIFSKLGVPSHLEYSNGGYINVYSLQEASIGEMLGRFLAWCGRNILYFSGRIVILAPILSLFAVPGAYFSIKEREDPSIEPRRMIFWLFIFQLAISCLWPVFQFRYFVPLLPLLIGMGAYGLFQTVRHSLARSVVILVIGMAFVGIGLLTYSRVPSHTNYYDSNELMRYRTGEAEWQAQERSLREAALELKGYPEGPAIAPLEAFYYSHFPLILATGLSDPDILGTYIEEYGVRYILGLKDRESFYDQLVGNEILFQNDRYSLLEIEDGR